MFVCQVIFPMKAFSGLYFSSILTCQYTPADGEAWYTSQGELDEQRLVDGATGERNVFKKRGVPDAIFGGGRYIQYTSGMAVSR